MDGTLWNGNDTDWSGSTADVIHTNDRYGDPAFADTDEADYHIGSTSAAVDQGVDAGVAEDFEGDARLGVPDIGADEYVLHCYLPLVLRN